MIKVVVKAKHAKHQTRVACSRNKKFTHSISGHPKGSNVIPLDSTDMISY